MRSSLLLLALSACSLTLSGPAATRPREAFPSCDAGKGLVVVDALVATGLAIAGLAETSQNNATGVVLPLLAGVAFAGAALHGNSVVDACRKAQAEYMPPSALPVAAAAPAPMPVPALAPVAVSEPPPAMRREAPPLPPASPPPPPPPSADRWRDFWRTVP